MRRLLLYSIVTAILLAVAFRAGQWDKAPELLQQYTDTISAYVEDREAEASTWIEANRSLLEQGRGDNILKNTNLEAVSEQDFTIFSYKNDSLLFWSNTKVSVTPKTLELLTRSSERALLPLSSGHYIAKNQALNSVHVAILIPVRFAGGSAENSNREGLFPADGNISDNVEVSAQVTPYPVRIGGKDLCWLSSSGPVYATSLQWIQLICYGLVLALLMAWIQPAVAGLSSRFGAAAGPGLVAAIAFGLIFLNRIFDFTAKTFGSLPVLGVPFEKPTWLGNSLIAWLTGIGLITSTAIFFTRHFKIKRPDTFSPGTKTAFATLAYLLTMTGLAFGASLPEHLVFRSGINFNFDNLLSLGWGAYLGVAGAMIGMTAMFQIGQGLVLYIKSFGLPRAQRMAAMGIAAFVFTIFVVATGQCPAPVLLAVAALFYTLVLDIFVRWDTPGVGWAVIWLLFLSAFSSVFLYRFSGQKDREIRLEYAKALNVERDLEQAEAQLAKLQNTFSGDTVYLGRALKPWPFKADESELRRYFNTALFRQSYLFQHYNLHVYAFDQEGQALLLNQGQGYDWTVSENWNKGQAVPNAPALRFRTDADGKFRYMMELRVNRMGDRAQPARIYGFFDHEYPKPTRVYARLFYNGPYKNLKDLNRYDFAVQKNGKRVVERGRVSSAALSEGLANDEGREIAVPALSRTYAVYKSADGATTSAVGRPESGWYKPIYLFALLFTATSVFLLLLILINSVARVLPEDYKMALTTRGSLAKRIHYWNIGLIGTAFLVIGFLTYRHFTTSASEAEQADLDYRAEAVQANLQSEFFNTTLGADSLRRTLPRTVGALAGSLSIDANLYDPDGNLIFSTQEELAQIGILPAKMHPLAYSALKFNVGNTEMRIREKAAGAEYTTRYLPLRDAQNRVLAFLGVPTDLSGRKPGAEVSDFIGMLASLYVFLLLIAYAVTFLLARSIIRPVSLISDKIRELKLEDKNEPLEYAGDAQDELSELVGQYNRMVDKLEDSKVQMVRLEREGAWREMARQVAHDIKNPLTTMKLSMQQLERVSSNPEQAAAYLRKAITRLIEQIDSLAQIASEFSMFANLDIRQKSDMVLNEVVESVYDLFSEQKHVALKLEIPKEQYHILGDKNHLIRVFNNLVINAIQAIPSDRQGQIHVSVVRKGKTALVTIGDNGAGIPPEIRNRVFEPNFTTKTSGSGLGLAICRKIIEAHDGSIDFKTEDNEGTEFFVELPITVVTAEQVRAVEIG